MSEPNHSTIGDYLKIVFRIHAIAVDNFVFKDEECLFFSVYMHFPILCMQRQQLVSHS